MRAVRSIAWLAATGCAAAAPPPTPIAHEASGPPQPRAHTPVPLPPPPPVGECVDTPVDATYSISPGFHPIVTRSIVNGPLIGALDTDGIRAAVMAQRATYFACYRDHLDHHPASPAPGVRVWFAIRDDGSVHELETRGVDAQLDQCVCSAVARLMFPPPGGDTEVNVVFPFNFVTRRP